MEHLPHEDLGASWRAVRPRPAGRHLDSAASSRQSTRALDAAAHHARHEAELGAYVAEAAAGDLLQQGRSVLGGLAGMAAADVAFVESASAALTALLQGWRLPAGSRVACLPGEYAPNIAQLGAFGLDPEPLPVDGRGRLDLDAFERLLDDDPPRFVHLTHIGSHRGLLQPATEAAFLCREAGVRLVIDAAQSMGHADVDVGADAVYFPSRKWLAGPRGVGVLCVRPSLAAELTPLLPVEGLGPMAMHESREAHVAGRVGLVVATGDHLAAGPDRVRERLAGLGRATRELLDGVAGWAVVEPLDEPTAITTLRPPDGVDVVATRTRLLSEHGIVVTAISPERAPGEMTGPVLRVSPHLDASLDDLEALAAAL
ncbi:ergothioneine biosynthesis PLP-dependent enzyme EgtE [Geodermatophilus sp. SYSU D00691]